jgi:hypothetical protein
MIALQLNSIDQLEEQIEAIERRIAETLKASPEMRLLRTRRSVSDKTRRSRFVVPRCPKARHLGHPSLVVTLTFHPRHLGHPPSGLLPTY